MRYDGKYFHMIVSMHQNTRKERIEGAIGYGILAVLLILWFVKWG
ncbi:hypothetical protein [Lentilactobacillus farraginis]|nr:hypothetical protein [Lentilactobacillus farraginis]